MRPRGGMQFIDPINVDHVFAGGQSNNHLADAFKPSAVIDNEKYTLAYIDKKMADIINQMTKNVSKFDPKRPIHWIKYTIDQVPVLSRPNLDPFITFELTVRLVKGRQNWLLNPQPGQEACQIALAVDHFLAEMAKPRGFFQTTFPDYGGLIDGMDAEGKALGTVGPDECIITLDEDPAPADYTWASDDERDGRMEGAGHAGDYEDEDEDEDENMGDGRADENDVDDVKNAW
ncbi:hypothetical protein ACHAQH_009866 [Verticillium albo-atrum]